MSLSSTEKSQPAKVEDLASLEASFTVGQYGVWRVLTANSSHNIRNFFEGSLGGLKLLRVFMVDIWHVDPALCFFLVATQIWEGVQTSITLYTSNRLLTSIEVSLTKGQADVPLIVISTVAHILCMTIAGLMKWYSSDKIKPQLRQKVRSHFGQLLFSANLKQDLPTSQEHSNIQTASPEDAWRALNETISLATLCFSTLAQLIFLFHISRNDYGGPLFMGCCLAMPVFNMLTEQSLWSKSYVIHASNENYIRLKALKELTQGTYRQDVITGNLSGYIQDEYTRAQSALENISDEHAFNQYKRRSSPLWDLSCEWLDTLPIIYYAANAILLPGGFSLSAIAILQQTSSNLQNNFWRLLYEVKDFAETTNLIKKVYNCLDVKNQVHDGEVPYPSPSAEKDGEGMAIEVRDLSFEYPGSKSTKKAISNISFSIAPGQLVVIVGANGSGKSSLIKILNRLYTPTSGTILVDGLPMTSYRISDLREATADLSQDHTVYPLSIGENIGLGFPSKIGDSAEIRRAAETGGALGFVEKFEDAFGTTLQPVYTAMMGGAVGDSAEASSKKLLDKLEKRVNISGGETQRLIASRTFMRLRSGKIRCCTVDEPSSALDPLGELELFQRLREAKGGKTMFFVTHRFGHLTKHADVIICMKEGVIAEIGTHTELMRTAAEYAKLYNIQANAFSTGQQGGADEIREAQDLLHSL